MPDRVTLLHQLLQVLELDEEQNLKNIGIGNESWFFWETFVTSGWPQSRDDLPPGRKQKLQTQKCPSSVTWSAQDLNASSV
jgi:hypothetical protein